MKLISRKDIRARRHKRVRRKIIGAPERPRMSIMISNRNAYVQFIDDEKGVTLASVSTITDKGGNINVGTARLLGKRAAATAMEKGIKSIVIDRGGFKFHGRVKAIVDAAVENGLVVSQVAERKVESEGGLE